MKTGKLQVYMQKKFYCQILFFLPESKKNLLQREGGDNKQKNIEISIKKN